MSRKILPGWTPTLAQWQRNAAAEASTDAAFDADMARLHEALTDLDLAYLLGVAIPPPRVGPVHTALQHVWATYVDAALAELHVDRCWCFHETEALLAAWRGEAVAA